jgi:hypothetical protein
MRWYSRVGVDSVSGGRANGWLRQARLTELVNELDLSRNRPRVASIRDQHKRDRQQVLKVARSRPLRVTLANLRHVRDMQREYEQYVVGHHAGAVAALRRCSETNEPFTLLLRDFDAEAVRLRATKRIRGPIVEHYGISSHRLGFSPQDKLRPFLRFLGAEHPVILVTNHESRPWGVASARADQERADGLHYLTLADSAWTSIVTRLADTATLILIAAGEAGPGLRFELEMLDQIAAHNRTVVVLAEVEHDELLSRLLDPQLAAENESLPSSSLFRSLGPELAAEHERRLAERESLLASSLLQRFYRRITLAELDVVPLDAAALAERAPFQGLFPLTERSQPNTPVRDEATERRIAEAERELQELSAAGSDGGDPLRQLGLMWQLGEDYNELRHYTTAARWMRRAIDLVQARHSGPGSAADRAAVTLPLRDGLIASLTNDRNWTEARTELAAQLAALRASTASDWPAANQQAAQAARRMWLHLGRMRRESDVPVADIEAGLTDWSAAAGQ